MPKPNFKTRKSLSYSVFDGGAYAAMMGFGELFFAPFAILLRATNFQLGFFNSIPQLLGAFAQLFAHFLLVNIFKTRKKLVCFFAALQALTHLFLIFVIFFQDLKIIYLTFIISIYWICALIVSPAWNSWMGDLVITKIRGRYFAKRNQIVGFITVVASLAAGLILEIFTKTAFWHLVSFFLIFFIAFIFRVISIAFLLKQYEPKSELIKSKFIPVNLIFNKENKNFLLFVTFLSLVNFSVALSAPFFAPYLLRDLKLNYVLFVLINMTIIISKLIFIPFCGKISDKHGNRILIAYSGSALALCTLFWIFSKNIYYLFFIQIINGFIWAGFEISSLTFLFDVTHSHNRSQMVAFYNFINGVFLFLGGILGGIIVKYSYPLYSYYFIFIVSSICRILTAIIFIPKLKEVRQVSNVSSKDILLWILNFIPHRGTIYSLVTFWKK